MGAIRRAVALPTSVLALSLVASLPTAQGTQLAEPRGIPGAQASDALVSDAVEPPAEVRRLQRPTVRSFGSNQIIDVHFFRSGSPYGASHLTESYARKLVARSDAWYSQVSRGAIRLRFAGLRDAPALASDPCVSIEPVWEAVEGLLPIAPGPGATSATWINVTRASPDCVPLGRGYVGTPGMWMRQDGIASPTTVDVSTFNHELGHNLGLNHSSSYGVNPEWSRTPKIKEYGDQVDFMGFGGAWDCTRVCRWVLAGMHAHNRNLLGLLDDSSIAYAAREVQDFNLSPVTATSGITAIYLPWLDRSKFVIDYMPSARGSAQDAQQGTGPGVYVRVVDSGANGGPAPYTALKGTGAMAVRLSSYRGIPILGFRGRQQVSLPDGSTVRVLATSPSLARIRITRPADVTPPAVGPRAISVIGCITDPCTLAPDSAKWGESGAQYELNVGNSATVSDDMWLAEASLRVNDEVVAAVSRVPDGRNSGVRFDTALDRTVSPGTYVLDLEATDLAGNTAREQVTVVAPVGSPPTGQWRSYNDSVRFSFPGWDRLVTCDPGTTCIGITVEAQRTCERGVEVIIDVADINDREVATMRATSPPLNRGERAFVFLSATVTEEVKWFSYRSVSCP